MTYGETKRCSMCKGVLSVDSFKLAQRTLRRSSWCAACTKEYGRVRNLDPVIRARRDRLSKEYRTKNDIAIKARKKAYHAANKVEHNAKSTAKRHADPRSTLLRGARQRSKRAGYECALTLDDIVIPLYCPVFPWIRLASGTCQQYDTSPSLDRIDPKGRYERGNVHVISWRANNLKADSTTAERRALADFDFDLATKKAAL